MEVWRARSGCGRLDVRYVANLLQALLELANPLTEGGTHLRQPLGAEEEQPGDQGD
jgi:hypothetical protein